MRVDAVSQKYYHKFFDLASITKEIVCTIVRKCLPIVHRAPRSMIHSHTIIMVDSIMFGRDRRERDVESQLQPQSLNQPMESGSSAEQ